MKKIKRLALLIPFLPLLLATKALPNPAASREEYSDIAITGTYVGTTGQIDPKVYQYELDIENIGNETALLSYNYDYGSIDLRFDVETNTRLFSNAMLAPGKHEKIKVNTTKSADITDWSSYGITLYTYSILDEDVSFENLSFKNANYAHGFYFYTLEGKIKNLSNYYYDLVFEVVYKGESYSFSYNLHQNSMSFKEELEMDKLEITSVKAYRSSYEQVKETNFALFAFITIIVILSIIFIIIPGLVFLIIFLSVKGRNKKIITW